MDQSFLAILRCPATGQDLHPGTNGIVQTADGKRLYRVEDGIYDFLGEEAESLRDERTIVKKFYESYGWEKSESGVYKDSQAFVGLSDLAREYTRQCNMRVVKHLRRGGRYFLDAGSGAIPWPEYLSFHEGFEIRICVDLSRAALLEAKQKLGDMGRYVLADLTNLPFKDGAIDAATANHVFYHVPADEQPKAFTELARVLSPGGRATVIYAWAHSPLVPILRKGFDLLSGRRAGARSKPRAETETRPDLYYHAHTLKWFQARSWPFEYDILSFRLIDNPMMKRYFRNTYVWRSTVKVLLLFQGFFPIFSGKYGKYPLIVLRANAGGVGFSRVDSGSENAYSS